MVTISLCMIVRDEEEVLGRCLATVRALVDEIIIVDTGSVDRTKEIAAEWADRVVDFPWQDDFAAARNFAFDQATMDYCLWLDADDILMPVDQVTFAKMKGELSPDVDMVQLPYHVGLDEKGNPTLTYYRERLIRRGKGFRWQGAVHEAISPAGKVIYEAAAVTHQKLKPGDPDRNLRIFERMLREGELTGSRERLYYARELCDHQRYKEAIPWLENLLEAREGWVENLLEACRVLARCRYQLDEPDEALTTLLYSLTFAPPRGELCCDVGRHFFQRQQWQQAIFWYELALTRPRPDLEGGFCSPDCYGYLPAMQLCVCYDRLGQREKAIEYNRLAGQYKPEDPAYLHNMKYFGLAPTEPETK